MILDSSYIYLIYVVDEFTALITCIPLTLKLQLIKTDPFRGSEQRCSCACTIFDCIFFSFCFLNFFS